MEQNIAAKRVKPVPVIAVGGFNRSGFKHNEKLEKKVETVIIDNSEDNKEGSKSMIRCIDPPYKATIEPLKTKIRLGGFVKKPTVIEDNPYFKMNSNVDEESGNSRPYFFKNNRRYYFNPRENNFFDRKFKNRDNLFKVVGDCFIVPFKPISKASKFFDNKIRKDMFVFCEENYMDFDKESKFLKIIALDFTSRKEKDMYSSNWFRFGAFAGNGYEKNVEFPEYLPLSLFKGKKEGDEIIFKFKFTKFIVTLNQSRFDEWYSSDEAKGFVKAKLFLNFYKNKNLSAFDKVLDKITK